MSAAKAGNDKIILIGDNPFHGISHLSQERARSRDGNGRTPQKAAEIVQVAFENGADGFLFSVSEDSLAIVKALRLNGSNTGEKDLYAIMPYAFEYVRMAVLLGGLPGLAKKLAWQVLASGNFSAIVQGLKGVLGSDPRAILSAYLAYEQGRIRAAAGPGLNLRSMLVHEVVTDMALALDMRWLFEAHCAYTSRRGMKPGFDTRNLPVLVDKFREWGLDLNGVVIACPFNAIGFQMSPSKEACEKALVKASGAQVLAFSVLAAGYLTYSEAASYLAPLPLAGAVLGASASEQARHTFAAFAAR